MKLKRQSGSIKNF